MKEKTLFKKKNFNLRKIIIFIMFFAIELFITVASYQFCYNVSILMTHSLFFQGKQSLQLYCFQF